MKSLGKKRMGMLKSTNVARGCYCGALCTCHNAPVISGAYTATKAAGWMTSELIA